MKTLRLIAVSVTLLFATAAASSDAGINPLGNTQQYLKNLKRTVSLPLQTRDSCAENYDKCAPPGATGSSIPSIGTGLAGLYMDVLESVQGSKLAENPGAQISPSSGQRSDSEMLQKKETTVQMCCAAGTTCLLLESFVLPFCWDKFTTNFFLPFSSYGSLTTGNYTSPPPSSAPPDTPAQVNLLSGKYTRPSGSTGNIYSDDEAAKPDISTLASLLPTQWTSAGVGSAIPASALGGIATWTTVIPGTTIDRSVVGGSTSLGSTIAAETSTTIISASILSPSMVNGSTVSGTTFSVETSATTIPPTTISPSTLAGSTVPGTIVSAKTSIVTGFAQSSTSSASATSTTSKGLANHDPHKNGIAGVVIGLVGMLGAVFGL